MSLRGQLQLMARYNVWATRRLLASVDALTEDEYRRDVGLFFKSVHGTLNHVLLADRDIWFKRVHDGVSPSGYALSDEVEPDRDQLKRKLMASLEQWPPLLDACSDDTQAGVLCFTNGSGVHCEIPWMGIVSHVFNHGTHHRGQITAALTMLGKPSPALDLAYMLYEEHPTRTPATAQIAPEQ